MTDAELRKVTIRFPIAFARVLRSASPAVAFSFLSGGGADQTGQSRLAFARYKGEAEKASAGGGIFPCLHLSGRLHLSLQPRKEPNFGYRLFARSLPRISTAASGWG